MIASSRWTSRALRCLGCLLLVSSCALLSLRQYPRMVAAEPPTELNMIPGDAAAFITIRVDELWKNEAIKKGRELLKNSPPYYKEMEDRTGLSPEAIERITLVIPTLPGPDSGGLIYSIMVTTRKPFDVEKLLDGLDALSPQDLRRKQREDRSEEERHLIEMKKKMDELLKDFDPKKLPDLKLPPPPKKDLKKRDDLPDGGDAKDPIRKPFKRDLSASYCYTGSGGLIFLVDKRTFLLFPTLRNEEAGGVLNWFSQLLKGNPKGNLHSAIAAAKESKHHLFGGLDMQALSRLLAGDLPNDSPVKPLFEAASAVMDLDIAEEFKLAITFECPDAAASQKAEEALKALSLLAKDAFPGLNKQLAKDPVYRSFLPIIEALESSINAATIQSQDKGVTLIVQGKTDAVLGTALANSLLQLRQSAEQMTMMNRYKQVGLSLLNYESTYDVFPFPGIGKKGMPVKNNEKPLLSWRVAILPYIEQENLYRRFKLDEPWDSEHNKKLIPLMPIQFAPIKGTNLKEGHTQMQVFIGKDAIGPGMSVKRFLDGTSNTILVAEAADAVPWTKPEDLPFSLDKELPKLGSSGDGNFIAVMCDCSTRFIDRKRVSDKMLKALITPAGGETIKWDD